MGSNKELPYGKMVPMVALVTGAGSAVGQRVSLTLAMNGARLVLLGQVDQRGAMAQVARRATCIGCPSADIHEVDLASANEPGGGSDQGYTPPIESLHSVVETVLSRQGRVDIIVTCPQGPNDEMFSKLSNAQHFASAKTITGLLATSFLAPSAPSKRAIINVMHPSNMSMRDWAQDLRSYLATAAAEDCTGSSGPTAVGMSDSERMEAAQQVLVANIVLASDKAADTHETRRHVSGAVIDVLSSWILAPTAPPSSKLQLAAVEQLPKEIMVPAVSDTRTASPPTTSGMAAAEHDTGLASTQHQQTGPKSVVTGVAHAVQGAADRALSPMGKSETGATDAEPSHTTTDTTAAKVLSKFVSLDLHGSSTSGSEVPAAGKQVCRHSMLTLDEEELLLAQLERLLGQTQAVPDAEAVTVTGCGSPPRPDATCRAHSAASAVWIRSITPPVGGILLATGSRAPPGPLARPRTGPEELVKAAAALPGAVVTPADPHNLEPEAGRAYNNDPSRHPSLIAQCFKPFNGETPHQILSDKFITPAELFYVRNHLPVPTHLKAEGYSVELSGPGILGAPLSISLDALKQGSWGPVVTRQATLQCAGNRRAEVAAVKLVEGRAPWNHGGIGNAVWTGVDVSQVLLKAGFKLHGDQAAAAANLFPSVGSAAAVPQHVVFEGWDRHHQTGTHFEVSIDLGKVMAAEGGVMLAWEMNGQQLLPDHGYPLRVVVPGFVGTRSVKWVKRISLSYTESSSSWQQVDYKLMPHSYTTISQWEEHKDTMPPIMSMPVQSAILLPEPGSVINGATAEAVWFRGYAWCGGGLPITRVDVSADEGATWELAEIVERESGSGVPKAADTVYSWVKWQLPLEVPRSLRQSGGKWRVCCKAFNINSDTQPGTVASVWNFRGLACNAWHYVDLAVVGAASA